MASVLFLTATDKERLKIKPLLARHSILEELAVSWRIESVGYTDLEAACNTSVELIREYDLIVRLGYALVSYPTKIVGGTLFCGSSLQGPASASLAGTEFYASPAAGNGLVLSPVCTAGCFIGDVGVASRAWPYDTTVVYDDAMGGIVVARNCISPATEIGAVYLGVVDPRHDSYSVSEFEACCDVYPNVAGLVDAACELVEFWDIKSK